MKKYLFLGVLVMLGGAFLPQTAAHAAGISIAPLEYKATLPVNSTQKGHVDIVNPSAEKTKVALRVAAFRQIDNQGDLQFYDSPQLDAGIQLDLTDISLGPHEGARIYFELDASKLPKGDVFAAILATTLQNNLVEGLPSAQVGSLLLLENGTAPAHHATIQQLQANWLQFGSAVTMQMTVANTDPTNGEAIGFVPKLQLGVRPYTSKVINGPLVFSGRNRTVDYRQEGNYFGPLLLRASTGQSHQAIWVFAVTGFWQWLAPLMFIAIVAVLVGLWITYRKHSKNRGKKLDIAA